VYTVERDKVTKRIADPIRVSAFGTSERGTMREQAYTVVRFVDREGKRKREIVPSSVLVSEPGEFVALLAGRGYLWPPSQALRHRIVAELSIVKPARCIRVTPVPGWHGKYYVLPGESYGPKGPDRKQFRLCYNATVRLGEFRRSGTLKEWKKRVAKVPSGRRLEFA
jgi:putative DNA primase/helicase